MASAGIAKRPIHASNGLGGNREAKSIWRFWIFHFLCSTKHGSWLLFCYSLKFWFLQFSSFWHFMSSFLLSLFAPQMAPKWNRKIGEHPLLAPSRRRWLWGLAQTNWPRRESRSDRSMPRMASAGIAKRNQFERIRPSRFRLKANWKVENSINA